MKKNDAPPSKTNFNSSKAASKDLQSCSKENQYQYNSWIKSSYVFAWCDYSWMFCQKCDIADLISAASEAKKLTY